MLCCFSDAKKACTFSFFELVLLFTLSFADNQPSDANNNMQVEISLCKYSIATINSIASKFVNMTSIQKKISSIHEQYNSFLSNNNFNILPKYNKPKISKQITNCIILPDKDQIPERIPSATIYDVFFLRFLKNNKEITLRESGLKAVEITGTNNKQNIEIQDQDLNSDTLAFFINILNNAPITQVFTIQTTYSINNKEVQCLRYVRASDATQIIAYHNDISNKKNRLPSVESDIPYFSNDDEINIIITDGVKYLSRLKSKLDEISFKLNGEIKPINLNNFQENDTVFPINLTMLKNYDHGTLVEINVKTSDNLNQSFYFINYKWLKP